METGCLLETRKSEDFHEAYVNKQSINTKILGYVPYENKKNLALIKKGNRFTSLALRETGKIRQ